jgi:iron complex transport system substrate-binding protein
VRIVSLLPSATESLFALGLGDQVVAITHECDYPPEAAPRPTASATRECEPGALSSWIAGRLRGLADRLDGQGPQERLHSSA